MPPLVSVVVPAYNNGAYLAETLDSVLAQSHSELEVIVSDHSSTDDTAEVMSRYAGDDRVRLMTTEAGGGAPRNWERVSREATGEYVKLVCGDDVLHPDNVARQVEALDAHPTAVLAASPRDVIDAEGRIVVAGRGLGGLKGRHAGPLAVRRTVQLGTNIFGEPACVLMRRSALERAGWWDARSPYLIDEATYCNVLLHGDFVGVPGALAKFRISAGQWSVALVKEQAEQAMRFHATMHRAHPHVVRARDVRIGDLQVRRMVILRRLAYRALSARMGAAEAVERRG